MTTFTRLLRRAQQDERGASLVEYALLVGLIAVVCISAVAFFGGSLGGKFDKAGKGIGGSSRPCQADGDGLNHAFYDLDANGQPTNYVIEPGPCP